MAQSHAESADPEFPHHRPSDCPASPGVSSWSQTVSQMVKGFHEFTIKGYSLSKGLGVERFLVSDPFTVGGHLWAMYFYPDGRKVVQNEDKSSTYVSAFVVLVSEGKNVNVLFEITLVDQSGKGNHKVHGLFGRSDCRVHTLKQKGSMWGFRRFIKRSALDALDYLKDDILVLCCTIGVVTTCMVSSRPFNILIPPSDMSKQLGDLLETGVGSDVTFEVGEEIFEAHKLILASCSPVFKAQFFGLIGNPKTKRIVVKEVHPAVFKAMILYIYSDVLPDVCEVVEPASECTSTVLMQQLLILADRYGIERLKILCESKLYSELTPATVVTNLVLAEEHHCLDLKSTCLRYAKLPGNLRDILLTEEFSYMKKNYPSLVADILEAIATDNMDPSARDNHKRSRSSVNGLNIGGV